MVHSGKFAFVQRRSGIGVKRAGSIRHTGCPQDRILPPADMQLGLLGLSLVIVAMIAGGFGLSSGWFGTPPKALSAQAVALPMVSSKATLFDGRVVLEAHLIHGGPRSR